MKHGFETSVLTGVVRSIEPSGTIVYTKDGKLHREDGPAIEYSDGGKAWYMNGKLHRDNGPAVEYANGEKSWYYRGQRFG